MTGVCTCGETRPLIDGRCARCRCSCQQEPPCESCFNEANLIAERDRFRRALEAIHTYLRRKPGQMHRTFGEACGVDACILCLAESTAGAALSREQDR